VGGLGRQAGSLFLLQVSKCDLGHLLCLSFFLRNVRIIIFQALGVDIKIKGDN
jgi:hypothetical protein